MAGATAVVGSAAGTAAQLGGDVEGAFAARVAAERRAQGRTALSTEADLVAVARDHSVTMATSNRLFHNTALQQQVQGWQVVAENVGVGSSVDEIHLAFMASPSHRAEILNARFTGVGIGVVRAGDTLWVTQVFRARAPSADPEVLSAPVPTAPPAPERLLRPAAAPAPPPRPVTTTTAAPSAAPQPITAPPAAPLPAVPPSVTQPSPALATVEPPRLDPGPQVIAASAPLPARPGPAAAGVAAAALLWAVSAGMLRVTVLEQRIRGAVGVGGGVVAVVGDGH